MTKIKWYEELLEPPSGKNCYPKLTLIICTLFTLAPNSVFFKDFDLKKSIYAEIGKTDFIVNDFKHFLDFYSLLNEKSVRQLAALLIETLETQPSTNQTYENSSQEILIKNKFVKKYLQKFHYLYSRYFGKDTQTSYMSLPRKERNALAIQGLFLLVGI